MAFCEIDPFCRKVLRKHWPDVPQYEDIRELTGARLAADGISFDVVTGGFPCQDASVANVVGMGTKGARTGLFSEALRLAGKPGSILLLENVPGLLGRGFGDVLRELARSGFHAEWECFSARDLGASHKRKRLVILAYPSGQRWKRFEPYVGLLGRAKASLSKYDDDTFGEWHSLVAGKQILRGSDGLSVAMERRRLHGLGNSVVPQIPELIGRAILEAEA